MLEKRFTIPHPDTQIPCVGIVERFEDNNAIVVLAPWTRLKNGSKTHGMEYWKMRKEIVEACVNAQKKKAA